eukprot:jgi/Mesvir1/15775/Mv03344-RA.1
MASFTTSFQTAASASKKTLNMVHGTASSAAGKPHYKESHLVFEIDVSPSMQLPASPGTTRLNAVLTAKQSLLDKLSQHQNTRVTVDLFSSRIERVYSHVKPGKVDASRIRTAAVSHGGGTHMYEAIVKAINNAIASLTNHIANIVVFTDGDDNGPSEFKTAMLNLLNSATWPKYLHLTLITSGISDEDRVFIESLDKKKVTHIPVAQLNPDQIHAAFIAFEQQMSQRVRFAMRSTHESQSIDNRGNTAVNLTPDGIRAIGTLDPSVQRMMVAGLLNNGSSPAPRQLNNNNNRVQYALPHQGGTGNVAMLTNGPGNGYNKQGAGNGYSNGFGNRAVANNYDAGSKRTPSAHRAGGPQGLGRQVPQQQGFIVSHLADMRISGAKGASPGGMPVCTHFANGYCRFGTACKFAHV